MTTEIDLIDLAMVIGSEGELDLPETDETLVTGARAIAEEVARRWMLRPGDLWEDPGAGGDLGGFQGEGLTGAQVVILQAQLRAEALYVEGVVFADVAVTLDTATQRLSARGDLDTELGPASFVMPLSATTLAALLPRTNG